MLIQDENGDWVFDWPVRGEDPNEERELRKDFLMMITPNGSHPIGAPPSQGRIFTYPSRIRKGDTDGS